nr:hypothetical protein [Barnesiella viscericola]
MELKGKGLIRFHGLFLYRIRCHDAVVKFCDNGVTTDFSTYTVLILYLHLDSDSGSVFFGRDIFGENVCPFCLKPRIEGEGGVDVGLDVQIYVPADSSGQGVETGKEPTHRGMGAKFFIVAVYLDMEYILFVPVEIGGQIVSKGGYSVGYTTQQMSVEIELTSLADSFKFDKDFFVFIFGGERKMFSIGVRPQIFFSDYPLIRIFFMVSMRR